MILMRNRLMLAVSLVAVMVLARPASAVEVPDKAVADDAIAMVWLDLNQIDAETIQSIGDTICDMANSEMVRNMGVGVPLGDEEEGIAKMIETRDAMVKNGAEGLLLMLDWPEDDTWSPTMRVLVKTTADADADALAGIASGLIEDGKMQAIAKPYAEGWHSLTMTMMDEGGESISLPVVTDGDLKVAETFNVQLKEQTEKNKAPFAFVFRMDDQLRGMIDGLGANAQEIPPQMAMMLTMVQLLSGMDTLGVSLADDEGLKLNVAMRFTEEPAATQFVQMYNGMMTMAPAILAQQLQNQPNAPKPAELNGFFGKLMMQPDGKTLRLTLDQEFFDMAQDMAPLFEGMGLNPGNLDL